LNTGCVLCGRLDEDGAHLFFKRKHVKRVWDDLQLQELRDRLAQAISAKELVWEILKLKENVQRRVITLMYIWWSERCRIREGDALRGLGQIAQMVNCYAEEWASLKNVQAEPVQSRRKQAWSKPPADFVKIKCDGAFSQEDLSGGWGYIMSGGDGTVICSGYGKLGKVLEACSYQDHCLFTSSSAGNDLGDSEGGPGDRLTDGGPSGQCAHS